MRFQQFKYSNNEKKPEVLGELPKLDTETQKWANAVGKDGTDRLVQVRVAENLQLVKNTMFVKHNKVQ